MFIKKIYPYLVSGNFCSDVGRVFLTPNGIVEIENIDDVIDKLLPKCDGSNILENIIKDICNELNISNGDIENIVESLFQLGILVDRNSISLSLSSYSQNPMLFFQDVSEEDVRSLILSNNEADEITETIKRKHDVSGDFACLLEKRMSSRNFISGGVSEKQVFDLYWASYGRQTKRIKKWNYGQEKTLTVPSGGALFPLVLYLLNLENHKTLDRGLYRWNGLDSFLRLKEQCDTRAVLSEINGIDSLDGVSGLMIVCADYMRVSGKYSNKAYPLVLLEAGHVMQNAYLYSAEQNIGFVEILGFNHKELHKNMLINKALQPVVVGVFGGKNDQ